MITDVENGASCTFASGIGGPQETRPHR
jgi:hypothetical protein